MPNVPVPVLDSPLQVSPTTFTSGQQATLTVTGANFTSSNVKSADPSSSTNGVSWSAASNLVVTPPNTLSFNATPTLRVGPPGNAIGNLTVTINKNTPTQSSATNNNITYNSPPPRKAM